MHVQGGVHASTEVTPAAWILAFLTFWVIQFVTLIIRADQHIFGKCCSAESENSLHGREDFNQQTVDQTAWPLLIRSPGYEVGLGLLHRSQRSWLQDWLLGHVTAAPKLWDITRKEGEGRVLSSSEKLACTCLIPQAILLLFCFVA